MQDGVHVCEMVCLCAGGRACARAGVHARGMGAHACGMACMCAEWCACVRVGVHARGRAGMRAGKHVCVCVCVCVCVRERERESMQACGACKYVGWDQGVTHPQTRGSSSATSTCHLPITGVCLSVPHMYGTLVQVYSTTYAWYTSTTSHMPGALVPYAHYRISYDVSNAPVPHVQYHPLGHTGTTCSVPL